MNNPLVSVIIPTFNSEKYLRQTLENVFEQTYKNIEVIVSDDGSTDNTLQILDDFKDRITLVKGAHKGVSAARNNAIRHSHGEILAFLDSDDLWEPHKLELQLAYMQQHPQFALVYSYSTNFTDRDDSKNLALVRKMDLEGFIFKELFTQGNPTTSTVIVRRDVFDEVGGYDETLKAAEDYDLNLRISQKHQIGRVAESLLRRRIHPQSFFSSGYNNQYAYTIPLWSKYLNDPAIEKQLGLNKNEFMSNFILRFIFKNLYDGMTELIPEKLQELEKYSPEKVAIARRLVTTNDDSLESWQPLIIEFDAWYKDVEHKAKLFGRKNR